MDKVKVNDRKIEKYKKQLEEEKERLEKEIRELRAFPDFSYGSTDDDSQMEVEAYANQLGLVKKLDILLKSVKNALKRIEEGKFGICDICTGPIEGARLKAAVDTKICKVCETKR